MVVRLALVLARSALLLATPGCEPGEIEGAARVPMEAPFPDDGLALTPPMGWSSWNAFGCAIDEQLMRAQADALVDLGLRELGYVYVNVDDCWMAGARAADGTLPADPERFPSGMRALADYVHARGLKLGLYSSPGEWTCDGLPGSGGHEDLDARQYAAWGVDYLKYDRCGADAHATVAGFLRMRDALRRTGRPVVFSINPNGATWERPWREVAHLWRTTPDIKPVWSRACSWWCGVLQLVELNQPLARAAGPGGWNDPDMLEVGVRTSGFAGLTTGQARVHMSLWAVMAAPLIAGADLTALYAEDLDVYANPEVVAVDQDPAGVQGWRVRDEGDAEVWVKPLAEPGARAVALVNRAPASRLVTAHWNELFLSDGTSSVRDLWAHADRGAHQGSYTVEVPGEDVVLLRVVGTSSAGSHEAEALDNSISGSARVADCAACGGARKVGHVGNGSGVLRFAGIVAPSDGRGRLTLSYASGEQRRALVRVNSGAGEWVRFPSTGGFERPAHITLTVELRAGSNTIELSNPDAWAPDFDRIEVVIESPPPAAR